MMLGKIYAMIKIAKQDDKVLAITAAMGEGTGLKEFSEKIPDRFFDVGIAEQHAVTFAAGLATEGFKPFVAIYSTFLQRAYDQVVHDIASASEKVAKLATEVYGAQGVEFVNSAKDDVKLMENAGVADLPVCVAKTQKSLSDDPKLIGRPEDFAITVRNVILAAGAGFLVPILVLSAVQQFTVTTRLLRRAFMPEPAQHRLGLVAAALLHQPPRAAADKEQENEEDRRRHRGHDDQRTQH